MVIVQPKKWNYERQQEGEMDRTTILDNKKMLNQILNEYWRTEGEGDEGD